MERLTEKTKGKTERQYKAINTCYSNSPSACANKLGKYEDIEEELGVDLITYFKLKQGTKVYTNSPWLKEECVIESVFGVGKDITYHICPSMYEKSGGYVGIEEYGTTFALTKEELL